MEIIECKAREIIDSRGNPTVEVDVITDYGGFGRACVPSGASKGKKEALELRDEDEARFNGKGVLRAVRNVNEIIAPEIIGMDADNQAGIDRLMREMDGSDNKSYLGANAILAVSIACAKASADELGIPLYKYLGGVNANSLPVPMFNVINGGVHSDSGLAIQEFMICPVGAPDFKEAVRYGVEVFYSLKNILKEKGLTISVGDEGGFAPQISSTAEVFEVLIEAVEKANYKIGQDIYLAIDCAGSNFKRDNGYLLQDISKSPISSDSLLKHYVEWVDKNHLISIEDGFDEEDWDGFTKLVRELGNRCQIVGDDLLVTKIELIQKAIKLKAVNAVLIKSNQIGTVTETLNAIEIKSCQCCFDKIKSNRDCNRNIKCN